MFVRIKRIARSAGNSFFVREYIYRGHLRQTKTNIYPNEVFQSLPAESTGEYCVGSDTSRAGSLIAVTCFVRSALSTELPRIRCFASFDRPSLLQEHSQFSLATFPRYVTNATLQVYPRGSSRDPSRERGINGETPLTRINVESLEFSQHFWRYERGIAIPPYRVRESSCAQFRDVLGVTGCGRKSSQELGLP